MRQSIAILVTVFALPAIAENSIPVISGHSEEAQFRTTLFIENASKEKVTCRFELPNEEAIRTATPNSTEIYPQFLRHLTTPVTARVDCPDDVDLFVRIQTSRDGGRTWDRGRFFMSMEPASTPRHRMKVTSDLVVGEFTGKPADVRMIIRRGEVVTQDARVRFEGGNLTMMSFGDGRQPLDPDLTAEFEVVAGEGRLAVGEAIRDARVANELEYRERIAFAPKISPENMRAARMLGIAPFKAAPFQDPATGLIYMRERWYDPRTGTFMTPDPAGTRDSSNPYAYCGGDPVNCTDPTGLAGYFFDGTDNDREKMPRPTNVAKLAEKYQERVFYREGVGSDWWTLPVGGLTGLGGDLRLRSMYNRLVTQYNRGDRNIDIFGFSRGAALAVAFANLIAQEGIPDTSSPRTGTFLKKHTRFFRPTIRFLGIFDTVGSFGAPGGCVNIGYNLNRPQNVARIRHAVSRDERRLLFPLTSMYTRGGRTNGDVIEKSFRGAHSDVGGGYPDNDELARVPLGWMAEQARLAGVPLDPFAPSEITAAAGFVDHDESGFIEWTAELKATMSGGLYSRPMCYSNVP